MLLDLKICGQVKTDVSQKSDEWDFLYYEKFVLPTDLTRGFQLVSRTDFFIVALSSYKVLIMSKNI